MIAVSIVMAVFSVLGALDLLFGNKFGLGAEFERGLKTFGDLALSMIGMIVLAPMLAQFIFPAVQALAKVVPFEPSVLAGSLIANDMGGASLALQVAGEESLGYYNGLVVGSMLGATVSFALPFSLTTVSKEKHRQLLLGLACGICTVPVGCLVGGLIAGFSFLTVLWDLWPLLVLSVVLVFGLWKFPSASVKIFRVFGVFIKTLVTVGLVIGLLEFLLGKDFVPYTAPIEEGVSIVFSVAAIMTGAFPLVYLLKKLLKKPLEKLGGKLGVNSVSALGFLSTLATSVTTFGQMNDMDEKGVLLNSAFAVSAAFTLADHLAFTLSFAAEYVPAVTVGKLLAGVLAVGLALRMGKKKCGMEN